MAKCAQFSAELHITATLQLIGSLDTMLRFLESPGPGLWLGHLGGRGSSRGTVLNCVEQDNSGQKKGRYP